MNRIKRKRTKSGAKAIEKGGGGKGRKGRNRKEERIACCASSLVQTTFGMKKYVFVWISENLDK